eukprot:Opistho-2@8106
MPRSRVVIRARSDITGEVIGAAITKATQMHCQLVTKNDRGEDVFSELSAGVATPQSAGRDKENAPPAGLNGEPDYLPEDDCAPPREASKGAVARTGDKGGAGGGWFSSVGGYLARTLYW